MDRRRFLRMGGVGLAGVALIGTAGNGAFARRRSSLRAEFEAAATEYDVPIGLLLAMGYVNTLWEMPPAVEYKKGDIHAPGTFGVMQLAQNPSRNTLGMAATLTGLPEGTLKRSRAANIRGGAAVLAEMQGKRKPSGPDGWQEAVAEYGGIELYASEVYEILQDGVSLTISSGERVELRSQENVEVPQAPAARGGKTDYPRAEWRPAARYNQTNANRERSTYIDRIIVHIVDGSYSGAINWFQNESSDVSAHYVVSRRGRIAQCVRHEDIAWHAGLWRYNKHGIGIEHGGYDENPNSWTDAMYRSSARLAGYVARRHKIPVDKKHVVLHRNVPGVEKPCPGRHFNYDRYLRLVKRFK